MGQIHQMDERLATLIAAGEVITGPAAVVRELIENALDAGAATVEVTLEAGGLRSIRVADDGSGMDEADAVLCLSRHATSKLAAAGDLECVSTLGFRGEALAAIFAVSQLKIETRRSPDELGTAVTGAGGEIRQVRAIARRPGTTVEVTHLFFNTPARREYQDTPRAESGRVLQVVQRIALANPPLRLLLREGRRELLNLPPASSLLERVRQVYGSEFADALLPLSAARGEVSVTGFVTHPAAGVRRARRNAFAVNRRPFESFEIRRLLSTTFAPVLAGGARPEAILRVELPRKDVDANVSPDKSQVRFRRPGQVLATVSDALRGALGEQAALVRIHQGGGVPKIAWGAVDAAGAAESFPLVGRWGGGAAVGDRRALGEALFGAVGGAEHTGTGLSLRQESTAQRHGLPAQPPALLQLCATFLLCPIETGLLIVDQHAAHERVHYERLRERLTRVGRNPEVQSLIFPEPLRVDAEQGALLAEMGPLLERLGFDLTPAGPRQYLVQSVPAALGTHSAVAVLGELMEVYADSRDLGVRSLELAEGVDPLQERLLKTVACHAAVKAGQPLSESEMRALWSSLVQVELAGHDVHGRPAVLLLEAAEVWRRLGRNG